MTTIGGTSHNPQDLDFEGTKHQPFPSTFKKTASEAKFSQLSGISIQQNSLKYNNTNRRNNVKIHFVATLSFVQIYTTYNQMNKIRVSNIVIST